MKNLQARVNEILRTANCTVNCPVSINNRLTRTLGRAMFTLVAGRIVAVRIEFSGRLIREATEKTINDVLMHECAHVIANVRTGRDEGHGQAFKLVCREIGTTNDKAQTKVEWKSSVGRKINVVCPNCGILTGFDRECKTTKNIGLYRCVKCKSGGLRLERN